MASLLSPRPLEETSADSLTLRHIILIGVLLSLVAILCIAFFTNLASENTWLGVDNISYALRPWTAHYNSSDDTGFKNPPWTALLLMLPANLLSDKAFWGAIVFCTLVAQILCVPSQAVRWRRIAAIFLVMTCFPALRNIADANLEWMIIGGALLLIHGYSHRRPWVLALGVLIITAKMQSVSLLLVVLAFYVLFSWPWALIFRTALLTGLVVVPSLVWRGAEWLKAINNYYLINTPIDMSLDATLRRLYVSEPLIALALALVIGVTLWLCWRTRFHFDQEKAALLVTASILVAPYVGANAPVNIAALGLTLLVVKRFWLGLALFVLINLPYFWSLEQLYGQSNYWSAFALLVWIIFLVRIGGQRVSAVVQANEHKDSSR